MNARADISWPGCLAAAVAALAVACSEAPTVRIVDGDATRGRATFQRLQCGACHQAPGISAARGRVGPPLAGFARRVFVAGKWPNDPAYLLRWLRDPPAMAPRTAMPALVPDEATARDLAAWLYTLE